MQEILSALWHQSPTQWIALITGITYVVLAAYEKPLCWPFGIVSCTVIAMDDFAIFQLYADGVLQIFYVLFGFLGLYFWIFRSTGAEPLHVSSQSWHRHIVPIVICGLASVPIAMLLRKYTHASFSYLDTLTTLLSLWATWLLVRKVLENWLYWVAIDAVYVVLFWIRGGKLIALLYLIYLIIAILGYVQWKKKANTAPECLPASA